MEINKKILLIIIVIGIGIMIGIGMTYYVKIPPKAVIENEISSHYGTIYTGKIMLLNNVWGATNKELNGYLKSYMYTKSDGSFGWEWDRPDPRPNSSTYIPPIYPEVVVGSTSKPSRYTTKIFPIKYGDIYNWSSNINFEYPKSPNGLYNFAYDIYFLENNSKKLNIMVWIEGHYNGPPMGEISDGINNYIHYRKDAEWEWHVFELKNQGDSNHQVDIKKLLDNAFPKGYIKNNWIIPGIELGNEIWRGRGRIQINKYDVIINDQLISTIKANNKNSQREELRFITVGDPHIGANVNNSYKLQQVVNLANQAFEEKKLDFIEFSGDLADTVDTPKKEQEAANIINALNPNIIRYKMAGNHDVIGSPCVNVAEFLNKGIIIDDKSCIFRSIQGVYPEQFYKFVKSGKTYNIIIPGIYAESWNTNPIWYFNFNDHNIDKSLPTLVFNHGPLIGGSNPFFYYSTNMNNELSDFKYLIGVYAGHTHRPANTVIDNTRYVVDDALQDTDYVGYTRVKDDYSTDYVQIPYRINGQQAKFADPFS